LTDTRCSSGTGNRFNGAAGPLCSKAWQTRGRTQKPGGTSWRAGVGCESGLVHGALSRLGLF